MTYIIKSLSIIMAVVLILVSIPVFSVLNISAETVTTVRITGTNVNVRKAPAVASDNIIEKVSNIKATVLEKKTVSSSEIWYKISYQSGSGEEKQGYVFYDSDYMSVYTYTPDASFEQKIAAFPDSYKADLRELHSQYPNWEFIAEKVKYKDKEVTFSGAVMEQFNNLRKKVQIGSKLQPISWRSMGLGSYDWKKKEWVSSEGGWTGASKEVIAYYMDPRNFLNDSEIYMFMEQSYNATGQNEAGVQKLISGTFLENSYTPVSDEVGGGSYLKVIMEAAKKSGVNPYVIASKIIQEQGREGKGSLISGTYGSYKGYYNFFNVGATGTSDTDVIVSGLEMAKAKGWTNRYLSILGGAKFLGENYISKGQDTYYYQGYNVHGGGTHQYATAVHDSYNKGKNLAGTYKNQKDMKLSFVIPVFSDMPSKASPMPEKSDKKNNYYFSDISVSGLTPSFYMFTNEYDLSVSGDCMITLKTVSGAAYASKSEYSLSKGLNRIVLSAKAETGYTNEYVITVNATTASKLIIKYEGEGTPSGSGSFFLGDTNGDSQINILDLAKIQMHILKVKLLKDTYLKAADINKDGKVDILDLARVQMHILGKKTIVQ